MNPRLLIAALLLAIGLGQPAHAARGVGVYGSDESMYFIAPSSELGNAGEKLALCVLVSRWHLFWLGIYGTQEFVLAENNCEADSLYTITEENFKAMRAAGVFGADVPETPPLSFNALFTMFGIWMAVVGLWLLVFLKRRLTGRRSAA